MIDLGGLSGLQELKLFYISVIIVIVLLIRGWNMYNKARYGKKKRRSTAKGVSEERLENSFKLPHNSVKKLQDMREITVDFLEDNQFHFKDTKNVSNHFDGYFRST